MKYILFDLDGTLANTIGDIQGAINHVLQLCYCPTITEEQCMEVVGNGLKNALKGALILNHRAFEPDEMEILHHELITYYSEHPSDKTKPYKGMTEFLLRLKEKGYVLGVLSNKSDILVKQIIKDIFPDNLFSFIHGGCDTLPMKPDKGALDPFLEVMKIEKDEVLYVGDSEVDFNFIKNTEVKGCIVTWGFRTKEKLVEIGASPLLDSINQLEEFIYVS